MTRDEILKDKKWTWSIVDSPKRAPRLWALYDKLKKESPVAIQHGYPESAPSTQYWWPGFDEDQQEYDDAIAEAIDNYIKEQANSDESYGPTGIANPADYIQFDGSSFDDDDYEEWQGEY